MAGAGAQRPRVGTRGPEWRDRTVERRQGSEVQQNDRERNRTAACNSERRGLRPNRPGVLPWTTGSWVDVDHGAPCQSRQINIGAVGSGQRQYGQTHACQVTRRPVVFGRGKPGRQLGWVMRRRHAHPSFCVPCQRLQPRASAKDSPQNDFSSYRYPEFELDTMSRSASCRVLICRPPRMVGRKPADIQRAAA